MPTSSDLAIQCEGIGKRYRIGRRERYRTLRDTLAEVAQAPFRWVARAQKKDTAEEELWALKDVSLSIKQGETLGIIGRNGSGKSTLLKILSRVTKPTEGQAILRGRVGSLLEVGAGFHPELTGRENIFLNGAVLGMKRREIERKFDEIVEFSECVRMLDTPMKHYSSGMYVRLAFAVAAHLETEILLVDEVLAVGDAVFQKKCLGKIGEVSHQGRTVLFVSHNMVAVDGLCTRAICLHDGLVVLDGPPKFVTAQYLQQWMPSFREVVHEDFQSAPGNELIRLHRACVRATHAPQQEFLTVRTPLTIEFEYWKLAHEPCLDLVVEVVNEHGVLVFASARFRDEASPAGLLRGSFEIPADLLNNGSYRVNVVVVLGSAHDVATWNDLLAFELHDEPSEMRGSFHSEWPGVVRPNFEWTTELIRPLLDAERLLE